MNLQETLQLIAALKSAGVTEFKSLEHNIILRGEGASSVAHNHAPAGATPAPATIEPQGNPVDTAKAQELINTLKMSPEELLNQIFPEGAS